ncbi:MAG: RHS repeat protein, partial [Candidatus Omnitrophica bacterium]|nr:RHS repeat protein [Candidatus Omnitrophota bacterium]
GADFFYDAEGNLTKVTDKVNGIFYYTYDALNRLLTAQQPLGQIVGYSYDPVGLRKRLSYPDNTFLNYTYDSSDRLTSIKEGSGEEYKFVYDIASRRTTLNYPNGIQTSYTFDEADRLTQILTKRLSTGEVISQMNYTVNILDSRTQTTLQYPEKKVFNLYLNDELDRLVDVINKPTLFQHYNYDAVGNRTSAFENGVTKNYVSNVLNQYTQVDGVPLTYDANGNLISDGTLTMSYDAENRLVKTVKGTTIVNYQYDWSNRLMKKTVNGGAPIYFIYDGVHVIGEAASSRGLTRRYILGDSIDFLLSQVQGRDKYYFTRDGVNSTRDVLDRTGNVIQRMEYDAFGKVTVQNKNGNPVADLPKTNYLYTGRELITEVDLYNFRNRFYSNKLGRFLSEDRLGFFGGSVNLYEFNANSPLNFDDPTGLSSVFITIGGKEIPFDKAGFERGNQLILYCGNTPDFSKYLPLLLLLHPGPDSDNGSLYRRSYNRNQGRPITPEFVRRMLAYTMLGGNSPDFSKFLPFLSSLPPGFGNGSSRNIRTTPGTPLTRESLNRMNSYILLGGNSPNFGNFLPFLMSITSNTSNPLRKR